MIASASFASLSLASLSLASFPIGSLIDLVIVLTMAEGVALALYHRASGRGVAPREYVANLISGLFLMLALRCLTHEAGASWIASCLAAAGVAHGIDIWMRWRRAGRANPSTREFAA